MLTEDPIEKEINSDLSTLEWRYGDDILLGFK